MKRIIGFKNKGGMALKREVQIKDKQLRRMLGKKD